MNAHTSLQSDPETKPSEAQNALHFVKLWQLARIYHCASFEGRAIDFSVVISCAQVGCPEYVHTCQHVCRTNLSEFSRNRHFIWQGTSSSCKASTNKTKGNSSWQVTWTLDVRGISTTTASVKPGIVGRVFLSSRVHGLLLSTVLASQPSSSPGSWREGAEKVSSSSSKFWSEFQKQKRTWQTAMPCLPQRLGRNKKTWAPPMWCGHVCGTLDYYF